MELFVHHKKWRFYVILVAPDFKLVTPGIRPIGSDFGDQRRVMTPAAAIRSGSDYLVIGRPITQADNPAEVLHSINSSLS